MGKICDVSSRILRYYKEAGLLKPDVINEHTGYRYYSSDNMYRVQVIRYLSDEGFSLEEIRQILEEDDLLKLRDIFANKIQKTHVFNRNNGKDQMNLCSIKNQGWLYKAIPGFKLCNFK